VLFSWFKRPDSASDQGCGTTLNKGHSFAPLSWLGHALPKNDLNHEVISRRLDRETYNQGALKMAELPEPVTIRVAGLYRDCHYSRLPVVPERTGVVGGQGVISQPCMSRSLTSCLNS